MSMEDEDITVSIEEGTTHFRQPITEKGTKTEFSMKAKQLYNSTICILWEITTELLLVIIVQSSMLCYYTLNIIWILLFISLPVAMLAFFYDGQEQAQ